MLVNVHSSVIYKWYISSQSVYNVFKFVSNLLLNIYTYALFTGGDLDVIGRLASRGLLCSIDLLYVEHLSNEEVSALNLVFGTIAQCPTLVVHMDDEAYHDTNRELPK